MLFQRAYILRGVTFLDMAMSRDVLHTAAQFRLFGQAFFRVDMAFGFGQPEGYAAKIHTFAELKELSL